MTKRQLVELVSEKLADSFSNNDIKLAANILFKDMAAALKEGDNIEIRGLGSFKLIEREARTGRNPKTGASVKIPSKKSIHFKPGKELKERVDN